MGPTVYTVATDTRADPPACKARLGLATVGRRAARRHDIALSSLSASDVRSSPARPAREPLAIPAKLKPRRCVHFGWYYQKQVQSPGKLA